MNNNHQQKVPVTACRVRHSFATIVFSVVALFTMSGCAAMSTGWQPGKVAPASAQKPVDDDTALWERPDGSMVRSGDAFQKKSSSLDMEKIGGMLGKANLPSGSYLLGPGDEVTVTIWGYDKLSRTAAIKENGTIFAPYVGNVKLAGMTLVEAQQVLTEKYSTYIRNPQLDLNIADYASKKLFLIGDLDIFQRAGMVSGNKAQSFGANSQAQQQLSSAMSTLAGAYGMGGIVGGGSIGSTTGSRKSNKVNNLAAAAKNDTGESISRVVPIRGKVSLFEAMLQLDVLSANVNWSGAYMIRDGKFMDVNFHRLMEVGDRRTDVMLTDRDILYLPSNRDQKVFVLGEVGSPTIVPLYKGQLSLVDALTQAGYVTNTALKDQIKVIRGGLNNPMMRTIDLAALEEGDGRQNIVLQAGDIIYVPNSFIGKVNDVLTEITPSLNTLLQTMAIYSIGKGRLW
ncbi:polysaccharide biosynthesis/export family protein [Mariprofundus ferrooxydans]|uniref:polysaccharide biosynthesis/export family protein n=1 Tax=Mariprofundus ferrooxydans TaxID=314344 RepID=UPI001430EFF8|nr:polysaccharide biosynthesis/export family protein [Mariprofundus ferrooxydans]